MIVIPPCYNAGDTLYLPFDTYDSNGASVTITGLAVTDIEIYKNGSTTQRASDNGYTLLDTDGIDFDGSTGLHGFSVDTSDNSDAGFYADGTTLWIHVDAITVDSQTVRFTYFVPLGLSLRPTTAGRTLDVSAAGHIETVDNVSTVQSLDDNAIGDASFQTGSLTAAAFAANSLDGKGDWATSSDAAPQLLQATTIATLASQTSFTLTAGSADDAYSDPKCFAIITDQSTATQKAVVLISDYVGSTKTVTLASAPIFTIAAGDSIDIIAGASANELATILAKLSNVKIQNMGNPIVNGCLKLTKNKAYKSANSNTFDIPLDGWGDSLATADSVHLTIRNRSTKTKVLDRHAADSFSSANENATFGLEMAELAYTFGASYEYSVELKHGTDYAEAVRGNHVLYDDISA